MVYRLAELGAAGNTYAAATRRHRWFLLCSFCRQGSAWYRWRYRPDVWRSRREYRRDLAAQAQRRRAASVDPQLSFKRKLRGDFAVRDNSRASDLATDPCCSG